MFYTFTVLLKKRQKKKRRLYLFEWKIDSFASEIKITRRIVWTKIFKKSN